MFKKLFGSNQSSSTTIASTKSNASAQSLNKLDPMESMRKLNEQMENINLRIKKVENDMTNYMKEALLKKKQNDTRGAMFAFKRKKLLEKEVSKLDGQLIMLEQSRLMIETSITDTHVFETLSHGQKALEHINKKVDIDNLEDIREKMEEHTQNMEEIQDFFQKARNVEDEDDLLEELNQLEAAQIEEEMDRMKVGAGKLEGIAQGGQIKASNQQIANESDLDRELRELEQLMS